VVAHRRRRQAGLQFRGDVVADRLLLGVGVDVVEDCSAEVGVIDHSIERRYHDDGIHMLVVRQQRADIPERHGVVVAVVIPRQQETSEGSESRMLQDVADAVVEA